MIYELPNFVSFTPYLAVGGVYRLREAIGVNDDGTEYVKKSFADAERKKLQDENEELHYKLNKAEHTYANWRDMSIASAAARHMVREAIGELFGPVASLDSEEGVLHRGPEPHHEAEAVIEALKRVADHIEALEAVRTELAAMGDKVAAIAEPTEAMLDAFQKGFVNQLQIRHKSRFKQPHQTTDIERMSAEKAGLLAMLKVIG